MEKLLEVINIEVGLNRIEQKVCGTEAVQRGRSIGTTSAAASEVYKRESENK